MPNPHWLEISYWISQIVLTLIALGAACVAWTQVKATHEARAAQMRVMNATLLMELDKRWDSSDLRKSRRLYTAAAAKIDAHLAAIGQPRDKANIRAGWTRFLKDCRANNKEDYSQLLMMLSFFETVGLMVKKDYISEDYVIDLLEGPIVNIGLRFGDHIAERSKEAGVPHGLYENALRLYEKVANTTD